MKSRLFIWIMLLWCNSMYAQKNTTAKETPQPCMSGEDAGRLPGKYYDHTQPKYPTNLGSSPAQDKTAMTRILIMLEKLEEASRSNFQLTGCVARVSFSTLQKSFIGSYFYSGYEYQLAAYQNVCHVTQHIVKTVDEYRTVLRVGVNPPVVSGYIIPGGTGTFYLTDKIRYDISIDAKLGPHYEKDRANSPSHISQYISEDWVLTGRSNNYKDKHGDFLKIINGNGYVENWMAGARDDKPNPKAYKWVDRHWLITKPGIPLLVPVSRKQYLEDLLEYYEIEKANFLYSLAEKVKSDAGSTSEYAKKRMVIYEADKAAYPKIYEAKKEKVKQLLATQKPDWLQKPAIVSAASEDGNQRLAALDKFYDTGNEKTVALYNYNPDYFKSGAGQPVKPVLFEVKFRYEIGEDRGFSERLFNNFLKNYDMDALRRMLE